MNSIKKWNRLSALAVLCVALLSVACFWVTVERVDPLLEQRRLYLAKLDPAQRRQIQQAFERFSNFDVERQQQLRTLHEQLAAADDEQQLRQIMQNYYKWLESVPPFRRVELRQMPPEERIEQIKIILGQQYEAEKRRAAFRSQFLRELAQRLLPPGVKPDQLEGVRKWIESVTQQGVKRFVAELPQSRQERILSTYQRFSSDKEEQMRICCWLWLGWQREHEGRVGPVSEWEKQSLMEALPADLQSGLTKLPPDKQEMALRQIVTFVLLEKLARPPWAKPPAVLDEREIAALLDERLSPEQKDELWRLSPQERRARLWWELLRARYGGRMPLPGPGMRPGGFRGRRGGPPHGPSAQPHNPQPEDQREQPELSNER